MNGVRYDGLGLGANSYVEFNRVKYIVVVLLDHEPPFS
jgi:hypothetical protein